jgi:hypothetical protein
MVFRRAMQRWRHALGLGLCLVTPSNIADPMNPFRFVLHFLSILTKPFWNPYCELKDPDGYQLIQLQLPYKLPNFGFIASLYVSSKVSSAQVQYFMPNWKIPRPTVTCYITNELSFSSLSKNIRIQLYCFTQRCKLDRHCFYATHDHFCSIQLFSTSVFCPTSWIHSPV